jgi:cell division protein FtsB
MGLIVEIRSRARHIVGPALGICAVIYFAYHAIHGDRGLIAWHHLNQKVTAARQVQAGTSTRRVSLEHRIRLLNPDSLDPDMLEERARLMLNYGYPDDIVIMTDGPSQP